MNINLRLITLVAVMMFASICARVGFASDQSDYPSRPIRILVGVTAGSSTDVATRILANKMSTLLKQRVVVENRPGAGSSLAVETVVRSQPDGYTLALGSVANAINASLTPNISFSFEKDLAPVSEFAVVPNVLVVHPSVKANTLSEFISVARTSADPILFASSGVGTSPHMSGELFNAMTGARLQHIPYGGSAQAVTDLIAGRVQVMFAPVSTAIGYVKGGNLRALAVTSRGRVPALSDVPTANEAGLQGFETSIWMGLVAPSATPPEIIARLASVIGVAARSDDVVEQWATQGIQGAFLGPEAFGQFIRAETAKWQQVVASTNRAN